MLADAAEELLAFTAFPKDTGARSGAATHQPVKSRVVCETYAR
jgi:hypothetical protein